MNKCGSFKVHAEEQYRGQLWHLRARGYREDREGQPLDHRQKGCRD